MEAEKQSKIQISKELSKKSGIYRIINKVNGHEYVGSAVDLDGRKRTHLNRLRNNYHHSKILQRAYHKYGEINLSFLLIELCDKDKLIEREQYWIDKLNPIYNISKVAGNTMGVMGNPESNKKKSDNHAFKGRYGKEHQSSKEIYQYDLNGNFIKLWYGADEIQRDLGFNSANIRKSIKNNWCSHKYCWSYVDYGEQWREHPLLRDRTKTKRPVLMFDINDVFIKEFDSIKSANYFFGKKSSHITHHLRGKFKSCYGYKFKYK